MGARILAYAAVGLDLGDPGSDPFAIAVGYQDSAQQSRRNFGRRTLKATARHDVIIPRAQQRTTTEW